MKKKYSRSVDEVKIQTFLEFPFSGGKTNVLSEKLNSLAICSICFVVRPSASGKTASGFPPNRLVVKTSQM